MKHIATIQDREGKREWCLPRTLRGFKCLEPLSQTHFSANSPTPIVASLATPIYAMVVSGSRQTNQNMDLFTNPRHARDMCRIQLTLQANRHRLLLHDVNMPVRAKTRRAQPPLVGMPCLWPMTGINDLDHNPRCHVFDFSQRIRWYNCFRHKKHQCSRRNEPA